MLLSFGDYGLLFLETITYAMFGQDVSWIGGIRLNLAPELADIDTRIINVVDILSPPDLFKKIPLGDHTPCIFHEDGQQLEFGRSQVDFAAIDVNMPSVKVDVEVTVVIALFWF